MNKPDLAKGILTVPAIATGVDLLTKSPVGEAIHNVVTLTGKILETGNSLLNPLFQNIVNTSASVVLGGASAGLLTNTILKDLGIEKQWLRYGLTGAATLAGFAGGSVLAPYLVAGGASYAIGKHGWKYGKEAVKRIGGAAWGLTGGMIKGAGAGLYKSTRAGIKGEQKLNPVI